jgi:hypothetical protein
MAWTITKIRGFLHDPAKRVIPETSIFELVKVILAAFIR